MQDQLDKIVKETQDALSNAKDTASLEALRDKVLGKKGSMTQILRGMGAVSADQRPAMGRLVNEVRAKLEELINRQAENLSRMEKEMRLKLEAVDVTIPGTEPVMGKLHPLTQVVRQVQDIFVGMGFAVADGPEVETDHYNFELLNVPKNHPARDMQDSFYINGEIVLRTHTSPVQARIMTTRKPPIRIICPGRVYRVDQVDATHSPVFHQIEGLVIDKGIHLGHLKGTLDEFARRMYGESVKTRFRPSFFPFTEPSAEVDISCYLCGGKDPNCRVCHGSGWIEVLGCGMVNPNVLTMCGIDPQEYSGFAFGMGLDRITNGKYGITDLRLLFENDLRFLDQF